jgi:hypothetical protein
MGMFAAIPGRRSPSASPWVIDERGALQVPDYAGQATAAVEAAGLNSGRGMFGRRVPALAAAEAMPSAPMPVEERLAAHYGMHGLDEHGQEPRKRRSTGEKILRGLGQFALAWSAGQGNYGAQLALRDQALRKQERRKSRAELAEHNRIVGAMIQQGMTPEQAELAAIDADSFSTEYNTRFRSGDMTAGSTHVTRHLDGTQETYRAPQTFQHGGSILNMDYQNQPPVSDTAGGLRNYGNGLFQMPTQAEQHANALGQVPGSDSWVTSVQDAELGAQGPTAVRMQGNRLAAQRRGQDMTDKRVRDGWARPPAQKPAAAPSPNSVLGGIMAKVARGEPLSTGEQSLYDRYNARGGRGGRGGRGSGGGGNRPRARNGQGKIVEWDGSSWVPVN